MSYFAQTKTEKPTNTTRTAVFFSYGDISLGLSVVSVKVELNLHFSESLHSSLHFQIREIKRIGKPLLFPRSSGDCLYCASGGPTLKLT